MLQKTVLQQVGLFFNFFLSWVKGFGEKSLLGSREGRTDP